jgi:hypothetical protein
MTRTEKVRTNRNGIKKLAASAVCLVLLGAAAPPGSTATETYRCEWKSLSGSDKGRDGESKIEISGNTLKWFVQSPVPFLPKPKISYMEFPYKILERNKVGVVAVTSDSYVVPDLGPVVGAQVLSIRKSDGALYVGGVGVTGVSEHWKGHCK